MRLHVKRDFSITFFSTIWPPMVSERNGNRIYVFCSINRCNVSRCIYHWYHYRLTTCRCDEMHRMQNMQFTKSLLNWMMSLGSAYRVCRAHGVCSQVHILFILIEEMCKVELHLMMLHFTEAVMDSKVVYPINWSIISCRYVVRRKPSDFHLF